MFSCKDLHIRKIRCQELPQGYTGQAYFCDFATFDAFSAFFAGAAPRVAVIGSRRKSSFALDGYRAKSPLVLEKNALLRTLLLYSAALAWSLAWARPFFVLLIIMRDMVFERFSTWTQVTFWKQNGPHVTFCILVIFPFFSFIAISTRDKFESAPGTREKNLCKVFWIVLCIFQ